MAIIDKIFSFKGNRQFSEAEELLIEALNDMDDFIADEAYINYTHTDLFAIDRELRQFLQIKNTDNKLIKEKISFDDITGYTSSIKDRLNEEWMEKFSKWNKNKKFIRSITLTIHTSEQEDMVLEFFVSENNDGSRASSIPVKRAIFSLDIWDKELFEIMEKRKENESLS